MVEAIKVKFIERMNKMKKLFAALLIAMLVVLPMTAFAFGDVIVPWGSEENAPTFEDPDAFMVEQDPSVVKALTAADYLTPEEPRPIEVVKPVMPTTGVFAAVAASAALLAMGLAVAKKN